MQCLGYNTCSTRRWLPGQWSDGFMCNKIFIYCVNESTSLVITLKVKVCGIDVELKKNIQMELLWQPGAWAEPHSAVLDTLSHTVLHIHFTALQNNSKKPLCTQFLLRSISIQHQAMERQAGTISVCHSVSREY